MPRLADFQPDLFGRLTPPGMALAERIVTPEEEDGLIAAIDAQALEPFRFHGWRGRRLTASFGWHYDFDDASFARTEPIPQFLLPLRQRAAALAALPVDDLVQVLLTRYDPGAGIGWHKDRPVFGHVVGISLGAGTTMRMRRRRADGFDRANVPLPPCSAYHLTGEARHEWEHSIAPMEATRWSITFRTLSEKGARRLDAAGEGRAPRMAPGRDG